MEVVTGATSSVLSKLGTLLQEEYYLQKGVKKDVESLQNELIFMRAALCKVAEVPPEKLDMLVKAWAGNIKELSYDMKDAVDTYDVRVAGNGLVDGDEYCTWVVKAVDTVNKVKARHLLAGVIAEMKGLTVQVAELRDRYKLGNIAAASTTDQQQVAHDINLLFNHQPWTWWVSRGGDIVSSLVSGRIKVRGAQAQESGQKKVIPGLIGMRDPVGVEADMKKLGEWMTSTGSSEDGRHDNRVRCILGTGGVGKTTVAKALYRKYGDRFDLRATVTVSHLGIEDILRSIHSQVMPQHELSQGSADQQPQGTVDSAMGKCCFNATVCRMLSTAPSCLKHSKGDQPRVPITSEENYTDPRANVQMQNQLENHSYLLLLDDVRSDKTWKELSASLPLPINAKESRIIITTRSPAVALACDQKGRNTKSSNTHRVGVLGDPKENSKNIFIKALSESTCGLKDGDHRKEMSTNTNSILPPARLWEMCVNQPVAITAMAAHVAYNQDKSVEQWKQVCSNLLPDSVESITRDGVPRILRHCYHDMPAEIKTCFLYLSMYPKGRKISRKHLTRRWIAEGFVREKPGQSVEQVADDYFDQLIMRKMVQALEQSSNGKVKNCKVYELVHDFIVSVASEESLVTVVVGGSYLLPPSGGKVRRLSLFLPAGDDDDAASQQKFNMSHVRSLAVFHGLDDREGGGDSNSSASPLPLTLNDSPILQVLDLEGCKVVQLDIAVLCNMLLLKYLSFRRTDIVNLPREIGKLSKLETLDVRETNVTVLPNTVWYLGCLVSILGGDKTRRKALMLPANNGSNKKKKMMMIRSLQVLSGIEITDDSLVHLKEMTKLRKLAIYKLNIVKDMDCLKSWIERLGDNYLHTLVILSAGHDQQLIDVKNSSFKLLTALEMSGSGVELPKWIKQLAVLAKLTLPITALRSDTLGSLKLMSSLFSLTFSAETVTEEVVAIIQRNKADSYGEIIIPADGFASLNLLRFSAALMPPLSFLDTAMPKLERLELRSCIMEGLFGTENLKDLKEVHLSVHVKADRFTRSLVDNIAAAARKDDKGTRVFRDEHRE